MSAPRSGIAARDRSEQKTSWKSPVLGWRQKAIAAARTPLTASHEDDLHLTVELSLTTHLRSWVVVDGLVYKAGI